MLFRLFMIAATIIFSGCASNPMKVSAQQSISSPGSNEAQVFFMRDSFFGSAINASLYEIKNGEIIFIGVIANGTKVPYMTTPGKHVFMVVSEAADFMEADLKPGKNYFSLVTPRMGAWKSRFSLWPIKNDPGAEHSTTKPEFKSWLKNTKLVENSEKSRQWYEKNKNSIAKKYDKYWSSWKSKPPAEVEMRTLSPDDGQ